MKMKFLLLSITAVMAAAAVNAQTANDMVIQTGDANSIVLANGIQAVLMPAMPGQEDLFINKEAASGLQIKLRGRTIELTAANDKSATVYLLLNDLKTLTMGENVRVRTKGVFSVPLINIFADANSKAVLNTSGKVEAHALGEGDVNVVASPLSHASAF